MPDLNTPSWDRFQSAQRQLNLVKAHAHEIVGVKREQVHRVVENFSKPGTYDITVHENGRVFTHQWTPPSPDEVNAIEADEEVADLFEESVFPEELSLVENPEPEPVLAEGQQETPPAPESPAAPRRRGRPKKGV